MTLTPRLDILGAALADSSRARMLCELMDGRAYTNKELASAAGVTAQTATAHLRRLEQAGLIQATRGGRCLYHRIAGPDVAEALETLSALAPSDHLYRAQQRKGARLKMLEARSCYDHLAGRLGVAIAKALLDQGDLVLDGAQYRVVASERWVKLGVTLTGRAPLARPCLDWTERLPHVAGPVGREMLSHALAANWLRRLRGERGLDVTPAGAAALRQILGIRWEGGTCCPH